MGSRCPHLRMPLDASAVPLLHLCPLLHSYPLSSRVPSLFVSPSLPHISSLVRLSILPGALGCLKDHGMVVISHISLPGRRVRVVDGWTLKVTLRYQARRCQR